MIIMIMIIIMIIIISVVLTGVGSAVPGDGRAVVDEHPGDRSVESCVGVEVPPAEQQVGAAQHVISEVQRASRLERRRATQPSHLGERKQTVELFIGLYFDIFIFILGLDLL